jgi:SOS-response transcriptional repressor LexA
MTTKPPYIAEEAKRLKDVYLSRKQEDRSLSQDKVAAECGWAGQSVVSQYMTGKIPLNLSALLSLSKALRFPPESVSPRLAASLDVANNSFLLSSADTKDWPKNATAMGSAGRLLPVVGYIKAVVLAENPEEFRSEDALDWVEAGGPAGPRSFVLLVEGKSMEPEFLEGQKVVIDPDMPWKSGDFVAARDVNEHSATLRQITQEGSNLYLSATNPDWPDKVVKLTEAWRVYGRARRKIVDL